MCAADRQPFLARNDDGLRALEKKHHGPRQPRGVFPHARSEHALQNYKHERLRCFLLPPPSRSPTPALGPQMGHFLYAAKAFDVLERLDPDPEYWEGKRGACVGVFQQVRSTMFFEWITQEE